MKKIKISFYILALFIVFASCQKDATVSSANSLLSNPSLTLTNPIPTTASWDNTVVEVAKDVSQKLKNSAFRKLLKHEVCLRFDGDANILISSLMQRLPTFLKNEKTNSSSLSSTSSLASLNFNTLQQVATNFPQMQIAVQTDAESWDPTTITPSVVYMPSDFEESKYNYVNGFDPNQNPITVSTLTDPIDNYVVISMNERTVESSNNVVKLSNRNCIVTNIMSNANYNLDSNMPIEPCTDGGGTTTPTGGTTTPPPYIQYIGTGQDGTLPTLISTQQGTIVPTPTGGGFNILAPVGTFNGVTTYRNDFKYEKMRQIRCDDLNQIEAWPAGAPEIRLHVFEQNVLNPSEVLEIYKEEFKPHKRRDINKKWWDAGGVEMHLWDYAGTGTKASFGYYEYDPVLIPNATLVSIGEIIVDILSISGIRDSAGLRIISGSVRTSIASGLRSLKMKNHMSEYIGKDDYSIFNNQDEFHHSTGGCKFITTPDL